VSSNTGSESVYSPSSCGPWAARQGPIDSPTAQLDRLDQTIANHIKDIHSHIGQVRDGLVLHVKAKNAASAYLVKTRCNSIEALSNKHHEETSKKLEGISDDVTVIRGETVDVAAGLESVTDFAGKINDTFTTGFGTLEERLAVVDKKLDTIGRVVSAVDRRLITAKDDVNELSFKVGEVREGSAALRAENKSLLEKHDVLIEQQEAEAERSIELSGGLKSIQKEFKIIQDGQTALANKIKEFMEIVTSLTAENKTLRRENQELRENSSNSTLRKDLNNTLLSLLQKFEAHESRIDQIFNIM
jgi:regulator of replication initiation timing